MSIAGALRSNQAEEFRLPCPAGEDNWKSRATFANLLADAIERNPSDAPAGISATLEPFYNNLLDCAISERTTLSNAACRLLGALPRVLGKDIHPHLDRFLPVLIRQCASTKAVAQKSASAAISNIITLSPYSNRSLWHVCQAFEDKYSAPKLYAPGWLKLIIENYYPALNPDRDYEIISRAISIGLEEADNNVRVNSRAVFWEYQKLDQVGAENIMGKLNNHAKSALVNDPNNPDKSKAKSKKPAESAQGLAQVRQQAKERMKAKAAERNRVASTKTISSEDFAFGALNLGDDKQATASHKHPVVAAPAAVLPPTINKTTSRAIAIHKKGSSHDDQVSTLTKKASAIDVGSAASKKPSSADSLHTSQNKKSAPTDNTESSSARPLLSAPVRRPRIVATPINVPQASSRPTSRTGFAHPAAANTDPILKPTVSHKEPKATSPQTNTLTDTQNLPSKPSKKIPRSELSSPVIVPAGKENANIYKPRKPVDRTSPDRIVSYHDPNPGPLHPPKSIPIPSDGTTKAQRINRQELDKEITAMAPLMPVMAAVWNVQDEEKNTQMHYVYPDLNHDGQVEQARRALVKALAYLNKDALDYMGFRNLRKLLETFGRNLIIHRNHYDQLFTELLPRIGTFEELVTQPIHEIQSDKHPRYIRQAVLSMVNILVHQFPFEWSLKYQGPALASIMIARCAYSPNCEYHEGAPYIHNMTTVNQLNASINVIIESCLNPLDILDSVLQIISASEEFLLRHAPHDSETQESWASFNPYSKINRLRTENVNGIFHPLPKDLETFKVVDPTPLPMKLPLLMETGLKIIRSLIIKAAIEEFKLGEEREDMLADFARHLMQSYNIIIRKEVMEYCQVLYKSFESDERFWTHFARDSERNLLHYYLERKRQE